MDDERDAAVGHTPQALRGSAPLASRRFIKNCLFKLLMLSAAMSGMNAFLQARENVAGKDPRSVFLAPGKPSSVPVDDLLPGGPPVDGIPALENPMKVSAQEADRFLRDEDHVLGFARGDESVAYPIRLLNWHEVANDVVGGIPVAVTYCPLAGSGLFFDRRLDDQVVDLGVSGLLYKSTLVMYDRETKSLWPQMPGRAVTGPLMGKALKPLPGVQTTWKEWKRHHPSTQVAGFQTGYLRDYDRDPYQGYESRPETYFPVHPSDSRLPPKQKVFGIIHAGKALAIPLERLKQSKTVEVRLGSETVKLAYQDGPHAFWADGTEIAGTVAYWFVWYAFYPQTHLSAQALTF